MHRVGGQRAAARNADAAAAGLAKVHAVKQQRDIVADAQHTRPVAGKGIAIDGIARARSQGIPCARMTGEGKEELAETLDLPAEKVADTLRVSGRHISVDAPFVEGEDNSLLDVLVNDDSPVADKTLINESLSTEVERALATLTERERDIIRLFFGINCQEMTLEEIGEKFGLTRERVRQIKEKAIRRLRHSSRSKLLKTYLG